MSYQKHNFEAGAVLFASQLNDMDNQIEFLSNQGSSFSDDFKTALLNCFENVAWINENGQTYYDALYDSLYPDNMWFITNALTGCVTSNNATSIFKNNSYVATITANQGYTLDGATVSITMGGNDVTNLYYSSGSINIPNVTGDLVITVLASSAVASLSAVFTQGANVIYTTDNLDTLKQYLVVTATYSDATTATIASTAYTLSGTLTAGTSTITVSYGGKTTTFNATVTAWDIDWEYTDGSPLNNGWVNTTTITGTMLTDGYQMTSNSDSAGCTLAHSPDVAYAHGIIEVELTITQMAVITATGGAQGFCIFVPGIRFRIYNDELNFDKSSTNTIEDRLKISDMSANTKYLLRFEYNTSNGATVWLNGTQIYAYSGTLEASSNRLIFNATANQTNIQPTPPIVKLSAIRCKEVV